jgi:E3 ubiquitin-protein ligase ZSWIM2
MKVWAEHQMKSSADHIIKCPMCREDFGPITLLKEEMRNANANTATPEAPSNPNRMDRHVGVGCSNCRMAPIEGKCYR